MVVERQVDGVGVGRAVAQVAVVVVGHQVEHWYQLLVPQPLAVVTLGQL